MRFEIATGRWTTIRADLPGRSTDSMTVVDDSGNLWVYNSFNQLIRYDISANTYEAFSTGVSATSQTRVGYDATTNSLYFGPAFGSGFFRFDIATETVTTLPSHPEGGLSDTFCTDRSGHVYAAGGCGGPSYFQYDIASNTWSRIVDSPLGGCNGSCVVHGDGWLYTEDSGNTHRLQLF